MAGVTKRQAFRAGDGTELIINSWLDREDRMIMQLGCSRFTGSCPEHGQIDESYDSLTVGFAVGDHADEHHGGLARPEDLLETGPYLQL